MPENDPAPALGRGLTIIDYLTRNGATSLERLSKDLEVPKTSCLRLLESLQTSGMVLREANKRYRSLMRLTPVDGEAEALQRVAAPVAAQLADAHGVVVEIWAIRDSCAYIVDRAEPEDPRGEINARIGFVREPAELDAITQVIYGWSDANLKQCEHWQWAARKRAAISMADAYRAIAGCLERGIGVDEQENEWEVRRYAAPMLEADQLQGICSLAECPSPQINDTLIEAARSAGQEIGARIGR